MVSDPIYGYVYFNREVEEQVINSIVVQRLRYIMQLQTAHLVYPGAVHTRFQHSLGVMHLTGLVAEDFTEKLVFFYGESILEGFKPAVIVEASRLAGLLHDIGHAAFGHSFEHSILWRRDPPSDLSNHEKIGLKLFKVLLEDKLESMESKLDLPGLTELTVKLLGDKGEQHPVIEAFKWILRDGLYPSDVMDFLRRDSYYAGTSEYGYVSYERLYRNTYPIIENKSFKAVLDRTGIGEFKQYMIAKASMYEHVYYHSVCRAFDRILDILLEKLDEEYGFYERVAAISRGELEGFLELTDVYVYSLMLSKALREDSEVGRLARLMLIERKPLWRRVGGDYVLSGYKGPVLTGEILRLILDRSWRSRVETALLEELKKKLKGFNIDESSLWIDILDLSPVPRTLLYPNGGGVPRVVLYTGKVSRRQVVVDRELNLLEGESPLAVIIRAYVARDKYTIELEPVVSKTVKETLESMLGINAEEYRRAVEEAYKSTRSIDHSRFKMTM
ncbi:MAG: HD domain-containing protein [Desulfurococcus sp.]|nr:HD domain-containing protein [Desulfurococcus sp.]